MYLYFVLCADQVLLVTRDPQYAQMIADENGTDDHPAVVYQVHGGPVHQSPAPKVKSANDRR